MTYRVGRGGADTIDSSDLAPITGLSDDETYIAINVTSVAGGQSFQLALQDDATRTPIDLTSADAVGTGHVIGFDHAAIDFNAASRTDSAANTIALPDHGLTTGDLLVYGTDSSISSTIEQTRTAFIDEIDTATDTITAANHGLQTGQRINYTAGGEVASVGLDQATEYFACLLYTSPSPRDKRQSRMPSSA